MIQETTSIIFTCDELWLLQATIRHEVAQVEQWRIAAPASLSLNEEVSEALLRCEEIGLSEAAVLVSRSDCLVIDYCVPQGAKSPSGVAVGRSVLLKSFRARRELDEGPDNVAVEEPQEMTANDVRDQLRNMTGE